MLAYTRLPQLPASHQQSKPLDMSLKEKVTLNLFHIQTAPQPSASNSTQSKLLSSAGVTVTAPASFPHTDQDAAALQPFTLPSSLTSSSVFSASKLSRRIAGHVVLCVAASHPGGFFFFFFACTSISTTPTRSISFLNVLTFPKVERNPKTFLHLFSPALVPHRPTPHRKIQTTEPDTSV